jgi:Protein phosphatase 2C
VLVTLASIPAKPNQPNEDFVAATPNAVVLLDGAGTPSGSESGCVHGVAWFARRLGTTLLSAITADEGSDLVECLSASIREVRGLHSDTCDLEHPGSPSATVIALKVREQALDYLVLADSVLVLDLSTELRVVTDDHEAKIGRQFRREMDSLPNGTPEHKRAHREYVETLRAQRNRRGGFWVASTEPDAAVQALTGSMPRTEVRAAALLTDGASRLVDRFGLATWDDVLKRLATLGPRELLRQVREAERADPAGSRWPRGKTHDDATVAYCRGTHRVSGGDLGLFSLDDS